MKKIILSAVAFSIAVCASAQTQSTYFLDNYSYGYRFNAASAAERSFVGVGIGNVNFSAESNIGLSSFLFPTSNGLSTGLSSLVSAQDFLGGLKDNNVLGFNLNENVLAFGFRGDKSFLSIEFNVRANGGAALPYDMFAFLKEGSGSYDLSNLSVGAKAYGEIAVGYSMPISDMISVGGRVKALVGLANVNAALSKAKFTIDGSNINVNAEADLKIASPAVKIGTKTSENSGEVLDITSISMGGFGIGGFGAAIDLGAILKPIDGLEVSVGINDLGFIGWNYSTVGKASGATSFSGVVIPEDAALNSTVSYIEEDIKGAVNSLAGLIDFKQVAETKGTEALAWNANIAAKYKMPFYDRLSAGLLLCHHASDYTPWNEARVAATVTPVDWFSFSSNIGANSFGMTFGAAASVSLAIVNLHFGIDGFSGKLGSLSKIPLPLNASRTAATLGISFSFGQRHK